MPSGGTPRSAHTRRFASEPSAWMSNAVRRPAKLSAAISVPPSGVTTMPLGKVTRSATMRAARGASQAAPAAGGSTSTMLLRRGMLPGIGSCSSSKPVSGLPT